MGRRFPADGAGTDRTAPRIAVASIAQETNTWSSVPCGVEDFTCHGLATGRAVWDLYSHTNTEVGGAMRAVAEGECRPVPVMRAWANSSGRLARETLDHLCGLLEAELRRSPVDGLVLSLHGAMAAESVDDADAYVLEAARAVLGPGVPVGVCLDLHANVTAALIRGSDFLVGYRTYPHVDQAETGARTARLMMDLLQGRSSPTTAAAKRPMLVPAEAMSTSEGPLADLRRSADRLTRDGILDISIFPVQPWLDVEELGFGVTVTADGDAELAKTTADRVAEEAWRRRAEFRVDLVSPGQAIEMARSAAVRPFIISHSADAPTAGAPGDNPLMIRELQQHGEDLRSYVTVTDPAAVRDCIAAGTGGKVELSVGAGPDGPVGLSGVVEAVGTEPVSLTGPSYTGMDFSMGGFAVVRSGLLHVLVTERPAFTLDQATFAHAGLDPQDADVIVVRSANGFRSGYPPDSVKAAVILDLAGPSTPRLELLDFVRAPRPLYPLDAELLPLVPARG